MKVTLNRDVLLPALGGGHLHGTAGQTIEMPDHHAKEYIKLGHAKEAADSAKVDAEVKPQERETKPLTHASLKAEKK